MVAVSEEILGKVGQVQVLIFLVYKSNWLHVHIFQILFINARYNP